jgi:hypothetical protein
VIVQFLRGSRRWWTLVACVGVGVPLLAVTATSAGATPRGGLPPGLQAKVVNVTNNPNYIYGEP